MKPTPEALAGAVQLQSTAVAECGEPAVGDGAAAKQAAAERDRKALLQYLEAKAAIKRSAVKTAKVAQPRPFRAALRQELAQLSDDHPKSLRGLARRLITEAAEAANPLAAIKEIANRLDTDAADEGAPEPIDRIERIIVDPANSDR
jgi:hypothetical protein